MQLSTRTGNRLLKTTAESISFAVGFVCERLNGIKTVFTGGGSFRQQPGQPRGVAVMTQHVGDPTPY